MKTIPLLLILSVSCSHISSQNGPDWVSRLRSGEERFKLQNGNTLLFRRLAGGYARDQACDQAIARAKEDIKAEYPEHEKVAHSLEVLYYDRDHQDCAVTMSVAQPVKAAPLNRSERAEKYAVLGTPVTEFKRQMKERFTVDIDYRNICWKTFYESGASYHDDTTVCWKHGEVTGYCTKDGCTKRQ